ncbi:restriction endonuclease subunit S [Thermotoga profunda]|uniref:restriction endonuclease subunit S n=1 Tax=Thermotoga profunda TaxID=1508420 RepID=UPI000596AF10|nr:restriction endonuclease subunit S [Thermotoga profunda]
MSEETKIPEGWKRVRLGDVAEISSGGSAPQSDIYFGGKSYFVRVSHIDNESHIIKSFDLITDEAISKYKLKLFPKGTIVFPKSGATIYLEKRAKLPFDAYIVSHLCAVNSISKNLEQNYLFYVLVKTKFSDKKGNGYPTLNLSEIKQFPILLPPLPEQQKIAEVLETIDNAIEKTDKIIEKYKRIKQGLMQDLLTKGIDENGNIRDEKTHKFKDSPIGRIPEEWEVVRLGEVVYLVYGERLEEEHYDENGISLVYGTSGILGKTNKFLGEGETVVIPRKGSINSKYYVPEKQKFFVIDTAFYSIINKERCIPKFLFTYLVSTDFEFYNESTGVPSLNRNVLNKVLIPLPSLPEQKRIASILSQIDEVIEKEQKYKEKLERIKKGLMEDLLTSKVRVNKLLLEEENVQQTL